jgi:hypothetical protein
VQATWNHGTSTGPASRHWWNRFWSQPGEYRAPRT